MLRNYRWTYRFILAVVLFLAAHAAAYAQATRTWVSGVGDDANPCSRTAPCKTFAGAISKTATGGEISVLDPGGFGTVNINKSITINSSGVEGGILAANTNGIVVNPGAGGRVTLRGLTIVGAGSGLTGIRVISGAEVVVDNCQIEGFRGTNPSYGILVAPSSGSTRLTVRNSTINANGQTTLGSAGIAIIPTGSALAVADIDHVHLANNTSGLIVNSTFTSNAAWATIRDSQIVGNLFDGVLAKSGPSGNLKILAKNNVIANNSFSSASAAGLHADGAAAAIRMQDNSIVVNRTGVLLSNSGQIYSYGGNVISTNSINGTFTSTVATQ